MVLLPLLVVAMTVVDMIVSPIFAVCIIFGRHHMQVLPLLRIVAVWHHRTALVSSVSRELLATA